jgi:hypothetical protein
MVSRANTVLDAHAAEVAALKKAIRRLGRLLNAGIAAGISLGISRPGSKNEKNWTDTIDSIEAEAKSILKGGA